MLIADFTSQLTLVTADATARAVSDIQPDALTVALRNVNSKLLVNRKRPEEVVSMLVHIGAEMGQMRSTPIWILRTLLTDVHIRRGHL
jgi:hypothetical protein